LLNFLLKVTSLNTLRTKGFKRINTPAQLVLASKQHVETWDISNFKAIQSVNLPKDSFEA